MRKPTTPIHERQYFFAGEVATWLGISYHDVEVLFETGVLTGRRNPSKRGKGGWRRISRESLIAYLKQHNLQVPGVWPPIQKPLVLVVEDNPKIRTFIAGVLEKKLGSRVEVKTADSVATAIEISTKSPPQLVVLDYVFEGKQLQAEDAIRFLKDWAKTQKTRVIVLTAHADRAVENRTIRAGASDFLRKPIATEVLVQAVARQLFGERRRQKDKRQPELDVIS